MKDVDNAASDTALNITARLDVVWIYVERIKRTEEGTTSIVRMVSSSHGAN